MDGRMHRRRRKYIPLTSSVDNKQGKSNGIIDLSKKNQQLIQQFIKNKNIIIMTSIKAYNKCVSFETDLMPFTQNEIKNNYAYYQRIMK